MMMNHRNSRKDSEGTDDEHDDFDTENEEASDDEDDHPGDAEESISADVGL